MKLLTGMALSLTLLSAAVANAEIVSASSDVVAEQSVRVLPLEGGRNFRDVGGYPAIDGRTVKWGKLYRSGTLYALTESDYDLLAKRNIDVIADLRTNEERQSEPTHWSAGEVTMLQWSYSQIGGMEAFETMFKQPDLSAAKVEGVMTELYKDLYVQQSGHYAEIFEQLSDGHMPLVMHCTAGKDRTGVGIALVLTALGVPRDVILKDYAMSARYQQIPNQIGKEGEHDDNPMYAALSKLPADVVAPLMGSEPEYLEAAFDSIEQRHGSVMAYIQGELGVTDEKLASLRNNLLES